MFRNSGEKRARIVLEGQTLEEHYKRVLLQRKERFQEALEELNTRPQWDSATVVLYFSVSRLLLELDEIEKTVLPTKDGNCKGLFNKVKKEATALKNMREQENKKKDEKKSKDPIYKQFALLVRALDNFIGTLE